MEAQLDNAISKYVAPLARKYDFVPIHREAMGMGALQDYEAGNLFVRIVNDQGIISFEVGPKNHPEKAWDVSIFKEYLNPPKKGVLNLSLEQQAEFLDTNWSWLTEVLSESQFKETLNELNQAGKRRSQRMFGE